MTTLVLLFVAILFVFNVQSTLASTSITVTNNYKKEVNVKIQGAGVGGCDVILNPGQTNTDCWCLWGTINYSFCAYSKNMANSNSTTNYDKVMSGKCPIVTGESMVCNDLSSLGNCYDHAYSCIDSTGLCHCITV